MSKIAEMKRMEEDQDLRSAGYRRLRATCVLAMNSKAINAQQNPELAKVFHRMQDVNYSMDRLEDQEIEVLYASFDDKVTSQVLEEFTFVPKLGHIRDLGGCVGTCDLCGKGDSRDDGANEDKIRYQFKLINTDGGTDVWVGSSCILQHGLHVEGARTAEEADKILRRTMQQHLRQWKIEQWRAENPDHMKIPEHWDQLRRSAVWTYDHEEWAALRLDRDVLNKAIYNHVRGRGKKTFRTASKFYSRKGFLTEEKTEIWEDVKRLLKTLSWALPLLRQGRTEYPWFRQKAARLDWLQHQETARRKKRRRTPRRIA